LSTLQCRIPDVSLFPAADPAPAPSARARPAVLTVSLLVSSARLTLERQLGVVWVAGEISNLHRAPSGHVYFTLKDASAQVKCAMWKSKAQHVDFALRDGLAVEVRALPSIYDPRGEFQLAVDAIRQAGLGALYERFARLKAKLEDAGWLAPERKRPLPPFPRTVGIVTSPRGAALRDVLTTLRRRWPALRVIVYPASVQGETAAGEVAQAIRIANARAEVDVLVVCRGGGSIEDLWAFNEERLARAVHESRLPIVSGVGHESDFTICDFVADVRAPTPTAAATLVTPDCSEFRRRSAQVAARLARAGAHWTAARAQRIDNAQRRLVHPAARLARQHERLRELALRLQRCWARRNAHRTTSLDAAQGRLLRELRAPLAQAAALRTLHRSLIVAARARATHLERRLGALERSLAHLNPQAVLERGYAIVATPAGDIVVDSAQLRVEDAVTLTLAKGRAAAVVKNVED
jgi:exodeoxyribonuclease VII large subunit